MYKKRIFIAILVVGVVAYLILTIGMWSSYYFLMKGLSEEVKQLESNKQIEIKNVIQSQEDDNMQEIEENDSLGDIDIINSEESVREELKYIDEEDDFFSNTEEIYDIQDDYEQPDFEEFESIVLEQEFFKDFPKNGNLRLGFFHFVEGERKWDKIYYITKGTIEEKNIKGDFDIWVSSDYVQQISEDLCEGIKEAVLEGDLAFEVNIGFMEFIKYRNLKDYGDCIKLEDINF